MSPPRDEAFGGIRYGTSSWSEKSWVGSFYPAGMKPGAFLEYYATQFDTVEADVTYYRIPDAGLARSWARRLPDGFTFTAKFPRGIVHAGADARPDPAGILTSESAQKETAEFLEGMAHMGAKCGPLVLQFPYFHRTLVPSLEAFLERLVPYLEGLPREFRYAVEVRNRSWIAPALLDVLRERGVALVLSEVRNMPHPATLLARLELLTADFVVARLIGDRRVTAARTETFDRVVVDKEESLESWARALRALSPRAGEILVYANNHYAGHGPATIRRLRELVEAAGT